MADGVLVPVHTCTYTLARVRARPSLTDSLAHTHLSPNMTPPQVEGLAEDEPDVKCVCFADCFRCTIEGGKKGTKVCLRCKNAKYLSNGGCVDATGCADGTIPAYPGNYGRRCEKPLTCTKGKVEGGNGKSCKCLDNANCMSCSYNEQGSMCHKCRKSTFLHDGACVKTCPSDLVSSGASSYGRTCDTEEYTCEGKKNSVTGAKCTCKQKLCKACDYRIGNAPGEAACAVCQLNSYLHEGRCVRKCPAGFEANGVTAKEGRACVKQE